MLLESFVPSKASSVPLVSMQRERVCVCVYCPRLVRTVILHHHTLPKLVQEREAAFLWRQVLSKSGIVFRHLNPLPFGPFRCRSSIELLLVVKGLASILLSLLQVHYGDQGPY